MKLDLKIVCFLSLLLSLSLLKVLTPVFWYYIFNFQNCKISILQWAESPKWKRIFVEVSKYYMRMSVLGKASAILLLVMMVSDPLDLAFVSLAHIGWRRIRTDSKSNSSNWDKKSENVFLKRVYCLKCYIDLQIL